MPGWGSILPRLLYLDLKLNVIPPIPALRIFTCACACEALPEGSALPEGQLYPKGLRQGLPSNGGMGERAPRDKERGKFLPHLPQLPHLPYIPNSYVP